MYNCTNIWDVVFSNVAPSFMEYGPFVYQEYDEYTEQVYTTATNTLTGQMNDVVQTTFNQNLQYKSDAGNLDTKMWLVNQAALGTWFGQNNAEPWREYITVLYNIVNVGLGQSV